MRRTQLRLSLLTSVGDEWSLVRTGASRYYVHKLAERYPQYEWQAERLTLHGGSNGAWAIYARRNRGSAA